MEVRFHAFLTLTLGDVQRFGSCPGHFTPGIHSIDSWLCPLKKKDFLALLCPPRPVKINGHSKK